MQWWSHIILLSLFLKASDYLVVSIDYIIITGNDPNAASVLAHHLGVEFDIKHLGTLRYFHGEYLKKTISMEWKRHTHQQVHIINFFYELGKEDSQPVNTLIETNSHLSTLLNRCGRI